MAGTYDLGKAYVQIIPSADGIASSLSSIIVPEAAAAGNKAGAAMSQGMSGKLQKLSNGFGTVGSALTNKVTKPAMIAAGALAGVTLKAGWDRMTSIDNARVKLEAIGNSAADVEKITNNALASVKGTAYGLDAAMTTAASAVAAGIQPGKDLEKYLTAVADASAVAGIGMDEMGAIFNKVSSQGKASNEVLQQMAERGIPIYQYLADEMGVTAQEVFDLASAGEIGLTDFQNAVTNHIGGAAKEMGSKTITGAIANLKASLSRIGANFLGDPSDPNSLAGKMLPMLNTITANMGDFEAKATVWGGKVADVFIKIINVISKIPTPVLIGLATALVSLGPTLLILQKLITAFNTIKTVLSGVKLAFTVMTGPVGLVVAAIAAAIAIGVLLYKNWDKIKAAATAVKNVVVEQFTKLKNTIASVFKAIGTALTAPFKKAWEFIKGVAQKIKSVFTFKLKLPKIKLPHFSISPKGWKLGDLLKGSIPSLGIDWYAKGGIVDRPTILGAGDVRGGEGIVPLTQFWRQMEAMADSIVGGVATVAAGSGASGDIHMDIYLYPSGPKMGEETVRMYDQYKKILG